jgi:NAD(P)-dependent dehydrogenase (short-subunit alcohol dehydrogenase family)
LCGFLSPRRSEPLASAAAFSEGPAVDCSSGRSDDSDGATDVTPVDASYIASKHGVVGLTRTAALEYVKRGIRVNAVNPGLIDTQIARDVVNRDEQAYAELATHVPIGRAGRPEEIASVVLWLCSPGASYVVGHALTVDGGMTVP